MKEEELHGYTNLPIGDCEEKADQEIYGPKADQEIGNPGPGTCSNSDQEIGDPGTGTNRNADQEIGGPGSEPYWHSRGYLPHFEDAGKIQHVTFHLADSLPKAVLEGWDAEIKNLPPDKQVLDRIKRVEAWMDAGHGSCVLREPEIARMVQNSLLWFDGQRYRLLAWVIMPNHVHVLFQVLNGWTVAKIVASWKKFTARKICDYWRAGNREIGGNSKNANREIGGPIGLIRNANQEIGGNGKNANREIGDPGGSPRVWHREYWDRYMRDEHHLEQAVEYIHQNPVKAGLARLAEGWLWSSVGYANQKADQEIGDPGLVTSRNADQEIGCNSKNANQEIGGPGTGRFTGEL